MFVVSLDSRSSSKMVCKCYESIIPGSLSRICICSAYRSFDLGLPSRRPWFNLHSIIAQLDFHCANFDYRALNLKRPRMLSQSFSEIRLLFSFWSSVIESPCLFKKAMWFKFSDSGLSSSLPFCVISLIHRLYRWSWLIHISLRRQMSRSMAMNILEVAWTRGFCTCVTSW